jgi:hypothetical protein
LIGICEKGHMSIILSTVRKSENGVRTATEINARGRTDLKGKRVSSRDAFLGSPAVERIVNHFGCNTLSN